MSDYIEIEQAETEIFSKIKLTSLDELLDDLMEYDLINKTNYVDRFKFQTEMRHIQDKEDSFYIYDTTLVTCKKLLLSMILCKLIPDQYKRKYLILAEFQTGKSGIFSNLVYMIFRNQWIRELLGLRHVIIVCPISDVDLREQIEEDLMKRTGDSSWFKNNKDKMKVVMNTSGLNGFQDKSTIRKEIQTGKFTKDTLIIIDEVHFGQDKDQQVEKFLNFLQTSNSADDETLEALNFFQVGVSATPFSEVVSVQKYDRKSIVFHKTDTKYYGVKRMYELDHFKQSWIRDATGVQKLYDLCLEQCKEDKSLETYTYIIIRNRNNKIKGYNCFTETNKMIKKLVKNKIKENINVCVKFIDAKNEVNQKWDELIKDDAPKMTTIYVIKNRLSAGVRIENKKHISILFNPITKSKSFNETITQGLVGRACCYATDDISPHLIKIYDDIGQVKEYIDFIETLSQSNTLVIPDKSKNVNKEKTCGTSKMVIYKPENPEKWPKNGEECNQLISEKGEIGKYMKSLPDTDLPNLGKFTSDQSNKNLKHDQDGDLYYQIHKEGDKKRVYQSLSELESLYNDLKQNGSISYTRPKRRFPILWKGELKWVIIFFGGKNLDDEYSVSKKASCCPYEGESEIESSSGLEDEMEELNIEELRSKFQIQDEWKDVPMDEIPLKLLKSKKSKK
jgi:hypothetical protein